MEGGTGIERDDFAQRIEIFAAAQQLLQHARVAAGVLSPHGVQIAFLARIALDGEAAQGAVFHSNHLRGSEVGNFIHAPSVGGGAVNDPGGFATKFLDDGSVGLLHCGRKNADQLVVGPGGVEQRPEQIKHRGVAFHGKLTADASDGFKRGMIGGGKKKAAPGAVDAALEGGGGGFDLDAECFENVGPARFGGDGAVTMFEHVSSTGGEDEHDGGGNVKKLQAIAAGAADIDGGAGGVEGELGIDGKIEKGFDETGQFGDSLATLPQGVEETGLGLIIDIGRKQGAGGDGNFQGKKFAGGDEGVGECVIQNDAKMIGSTLLRSSDDANDEQDGKHDEGDFYPAKGMMTGDASGVAVDDDDEIFGAVGVGEQPDGDENVFEGLLIEGGAHGEIALGVAGDFAGTELAKFLFHDGTGVGGGGDEIDLVLFDDPTGEEGGVVGSEIVGGEGFDFGEEILGDAAGAADEFVVEKLIEFARGVDPADFAHLAALGASVGVAVAFAFEVIMAGFGGPGGMGLGVESPVREVSAVEGVGEGAAFKFVGGEPVGAIPFADGFADFAVGDFKREQTFRANGCLDFGVRSEGGRTAEIAPLGDASDGKNADRLAALAFDGDLGGRPAAFILGDFAQRGGEIVLDDFAGDTFFKLRNGAAKWAAQFLGGGFPKSLGTASGTVVFGGGENLGHDEIGYPRFPGKEQTEYALKSEDGAR